MSRPCDDLRCCEFEALRSEIATNRRFVFERPLAIVTAGFIGVLMIPNTAWALLLIIPILGVLLYNLWFTANRLRSNSRIVAYIQLVHEPLGDCPWIGWENALHIWRTVARERKDANQHFPASQEEIAGYDVNRFYRQIHLFHVGIGGIAAALLLTRHALPEFLAASSQPILPSLLATGAILTGAFLVGCWKLRDAGYRMGIELERARWGEVFRHHRAIGTQAALPVEDGGRRQ